MKRTIELTVRIVAKVSDEIADAVDRDPDILSLDIPIAQLGLLKGTTPVDAKFVEFETMITEVTE